VNTALKIKINNAHAAISDSDKAISLNSNYAEAYYDRAMAKKITGDKTTCDNFKAAFKLGYTKAASFIQNDCKGL